MEQIGGRRRHHHNPADRFLGILQPEPPSAVPPIELSEDDIFSTPSGSTSPTPTHLNPVPDPISARSINRNNHGVLAALNGDIKSRSGSGHDIQPVFNHKASLAPSFSPSAPFSSRIMIPRPPPRADRMRVFHQSAPVNIPVMSDAMRMRTRDLDSTVFDNDDEEEEEDNNGVIFPPHEVVDSRHSPMLACSMLDGAGRTLKGRDLRQVRNAVWRKTGFID